MVLKIKPLSLAVAVVLFATAVPVSSAFAGHCKRDIRAIDSALQTAELSKKQLAKVKALRNKGAKLHNRKHHKTSLRNLHEAMKILGIAHRR